MTPERWRQVEELYHAVVERTPAERDRLLEGAQEGVRREVESLLAQQGSLPGLAEPGPTVTQIAPGGQLGAYRIEAMLGEGGMGRVFRAIDTRLGRAVAIKISHQHLDPRFGREARAISSLNHPHICALYDVGPDYLVMELCEGETLETRLKRGRLSIDETLRLGIQIAGALAAAHAKSVIHRDLKPGNIMLTRGGVKVLDFGLARSSEDETITGSHAVMGTPAYMAPEQRQGRPSDARTDIYSLGLVLHEMATGKRLAPGMVPDWKDVPVQVAHVIERCLGPEPDARWQSAADVTAELGWAVKAKELDRPAPRAELLRWVWALAAFAFAASIAVLVLLLRSSPTAIVPPSEFTLSLGDEIVTAPLSGLAELSPDGRYVVGVGGKSLERASLWIRALDSEKSRELAGTAGASSPFWSPDSRWIGFFVDGKVKKVRPEGGVPVTFASLPALQEAAWNSRGDILFRPSNREALFRLPAGGGAPLPATHLDSSRSENSHRGLQFLPDGRRFLFTARSSQRENNALYLGSLDSPKVKRILALESNVSYLQPRNQRPGVLVYYKDSGLVSQNFDAGREAVSGEPVPVVDNIAYTSASITAGFRISADRRVALIRPSEPKMQLTWFERNGEESGTLGPPGVYTQPRLSPDGTRVLYTRPDPRSGNRDIYSIEIARGVSSRLTTHIANDWYPVWSPDGKRILFGSDREGGTAMTTHLKRSMDPGSDESRFPGANPTDWSQDGRWISLVLNNGDLWIAPAAADGKPFPYLETPFTELAPRFSPDTKWLAYVSNETGRFEVYVRPFSGGRASAEGKLQISFSGGDFPVWRPDGKQLYYMAPDQTLYSVDTQNLGRSDWVPAPVKLFQACPGRRVHLPPGTGNSYSNAYDTHDGKRFLINCAELPPKLRVLLNWPFGERR